VLFEIDKAEKPKLDRAEGLGSGYAERQIEVENESGTVKVWLYYATKVEASLRPYTWYKGLVVSGAKEHSLPLDYIAKREAVSAIEDADADRHAKNMAIASAG